MTSLHVKTFRCDDCRGTGGKRGRKCRNCAGKGYFISDQSREITTIEERPPFIPRPHATRQRRKEQGRCSQCGSFDLDRNADRCEECRSKRRTMPAEL